MPFEVFLIRIFDFMKASWIQHILLRPLCEGFEVATADRRSPPRRIDFGATGVVLRVPEDRVRMVLLFDKHDLPVVAAVLLPGVIGKVHTLVVPAG